MELPFNSKFQRRGTPDAGVECLWTLPDGEEWGWQAKFFTNFLGQTQWGEIDRSVKTALEKNLRLRHYTICIPTSLPDERKSDRKSARQRWNDRVEKWSGWASELDRSINFVLWDESELIGMLGKSEHVGRLGFWFGGPAFTSKWFAEQGVQPAIRQAHTRYTPPIHVDVPLQQTLDALGADEQFYRRLDEEAENVRAAMEETFGFIFNSPDNPEMEELRLRAEEMVRVLTHFPSTVSDEFDLAETKVALGRLEATAYTAERTTRHTEASSIQDQSFVSDQLERLIQALRNLDEFLETSEIEAAVLRRLVIVGEAGSGKTHLLCKTAETRISRQQPSILLLGEQFTEIADPWFQIQQLVGFQANREVFLGALDAVGEASSCQTLILIDAVNEGPGLRYWRRHIGAMWEQIRPYRFISLAVSVRDAYARDLRDVIGGRFGSEWPNRPHPPVHWRRPSGALRDYRARNWFPCPSNAERTPPRPLRIQWCHQDRKRRSLAGHLNRPPQPRGHRCWHERH